MGINARISKLEQRISDKKKQLATLQKSIRRDEENLQAWIAERDEIKFISLADCSNAGLNNKICAMPWAKCNLHNCLLSYSDVRSRRCVTKMCKHLEDIKIGALPHTERGE